MTRGYSSVSHNPFKRVFFCFQLVHKFGQKSRSDKFRGMQMSLSANDGKYLATVKVNLIFKLSRQM